MKPGYGWLAQLILVVGLVLRRLSTRIGDNRRTGTGGGGDGDPPILDPGPGKT